MVSVILYPCMFCVALSMDLFVLCVACFTVFVNCLVKQFAICSGVFVILLLNVMELLCVVGGRVCTEVLKPIGGLVGLPDPIAHNNFHWATELCNICLFHYIHYNVSCNLK